MSVHVRNEIIKNVSLCSGEPSADLLDFDTSQDVDGLGGISLRLIGSEDVDLLGTSFSLAFSGNGSEGSLPSSPKPSSAGTSASSRVSSTTPSTQ